MEDKEAQQKELVQEEFLRLVTENCLISAQDKAIIGFILIGTKPAGEIQYPFLDESTVVKEVERVKKFLDLTGLYYHITKVQPSDEVGDITFSIAKEPQGLQSLLVASQIKDEDYSDRRGQALGYPQTAVAAFKTRQFISEEEDLSLPKDIKNFLLFRPSKAHIQNELQEVTRQRDLLKSIYPKIYNTIISQ